MFKGVLIGEKITVTLGVATVITGTVVEVSEGYVTFIGEITVFESQGWKLVQE